MDHKRTAIYVDGYNLYYGRLRGTPFKWLDIVALFDQLLVDQDPASRVSVVRYFSSPCLATFASHGRSSMKAQQAYHRGLLELHAHRLTVTLGKHCHDRNGTLLPRFVQGQPYARDDRVRVWKLEEKKTDVNLALAMYRDASFGNFSHMVVCSNDSDVEPALAAIRADFPYIAIGVVTPRHPPQLGQGHRNTLSALSTHADWTRHYLRDDELSAAQLPTRIATRKKPIDKPRHW